jgi:hypothetical protein
MAACANTGVAIIIDRMAAAPSVLKLVIVFSPLLTGRDSRAPGSLSHMSRPCDNPRIS